MAGAGIDIYKVSRWMGHSNVAVTDGVYTHLFATDDASDMKKLDAFVARAEAATPTLAVSRQAVLAR